MPYDSKEQKLGVTNDPNKPVDADSRREGDRERKASIDTKNREDALKGGQDKQEGNIVAGHKLKEYSTTGAHRE